MDTLPVGLDPASSAELARWILEGIASREHTVRSLVPEVFAAYCRVFHPAGAYEVIDSHGIPDVRPVTWAEIAAHNGRVMHAEAQFEAITGLDKYNDQHSMDRGQPPLWRTPPEEGSLDEDLLAYLGAVLSEHTETPDPCYFAHWGGYGGLPFDERHAPTFGYPWPDTGRDHLLLRGPVQSCNVSLEPDDFHSPNVWWPEDHSWIVVTDIDLDSTYIGGSESCVTAIMEHHEFEALNTVPTHVITRDGDKINPPCSSPTSRDIVAGGSNARVENGAWRYSLLDRLIKREAGVL